MEIQRHKTALSRSKVSKPIRLALEEGLIHSQTSVFDYGCGRGGDVKYLQHLGIAVQGWDPQFCPQAPKHTADVVNLGYVLNVIEEPNERVQTLLSAWDLAHHLLVVSAQHISNESLTAARPYKDGYLTSRGTFQKFYEQSELKTWLETQLKTEAIPVAPGIFFVFKDITAREDFLSQRYRRRYILPTTQLSQAIFEAHPELFEALMHFYGERGRLPLPEELPEAEAIRQTIGSLKKAFGIVIKMTDAEHWERIRVARAQDLMVYLALARFDRRPPLNALPLALQQDIKAHFFSYKNACEIADELLLSLAEPDVMDLAFRACRVGKKLPQDVYVHISALPYLPPELRVLEGCARTFIGEVEGANIIKLNRFKPRVSYLTYPDFDKLPHPALQESLIVDLRQREEAWRDYRKHSSPPILHRKEEFVAADYPQREKFARLTRQEEKQGLYANPSKIGTQLAWQELLQVKELTYRGHQLIQSKKTVSKGN